MSATRKQPSRAVEHPKQIRHKEHPYTDQEVRRCLLAVIAWGGNIAAAHAQLLEDGDLEKVPRRHTLRRWIRGTRSGLYESLREEHLPSIERELADRYRGVAAQAVEATEIGVRVARSYLENGQERDPARAAANLAIVADKTLKGYSLLEGKPTAITETRGLPEVMRSLIDLGVLVPQGQLEVGDAEEVPGAEAEADD
jgi:hypothetical protein